MFEMYLADLLWSLTWLSARNVPDIGGKTLDLSRSNSVRFTSDIAYKKTVGLSAIIYNMSFYRNHLRAIIAPRIPPMTYRLKESSRFLDSNR